MKSHHYEKYDKFKIRILSKCECCGVNSYNLWDGEYTEEHIRLINETGIKGSFTECPNCDMLTLKKAVGIEKILI